MYLNPVSIATHAQRHAGLGVLIANRKVGEPSSPAIPQQLSADTGSESGLSDVRLLVPSGSPMRRIVSREARPGKAPNVGGMRPT